MLVYRATPRGAEGQRNAMPSYNMQRNRTAQRGAEGQRDNTSLCCYAAPRCAQGSRDATLSCIASKSVSKCFSMLPYIRSHRAPCSCFPNKLPLWLSSEQSESVGDVGCLDWKRVARARSRGCKSTYEEKHVSEGGRVFLPPHCKV